MILSMGKYKDLLTLWECPFCDKTKTEHVDDYNLHVIGIFRNIYFYKCEQCEKYMYMGVPYITLRDFYL